VLTGAIIGFGAVAANGHWPAYAKSADIKIVAVVDRSDERRRAARELSIPLAFATMDDLARNMALDFVDICTPPALHVELVLEALRHGWNVLCEKPLVLHEPDVERLRDAMGESRRVVVPVHNWRYAPIIRRATALLRSGTIGELRQVEIETKRFEDCAAVDPAQPGWRRDPAMAGGGILFDHGWHAVYLARNWFNQDPSEVAATLHMIPETTVDDEARLKLTFPSGVAEIFLTWRANARANRIRLRGDKGEITIDDDRLTMGDESERFDSPLSRGSHHPEWFEAMLREVVASFGSEELGRERFEEAAVCLSVIRRAYDLAGMA
jgi:predicted dehydrogenase